MPNLADIRRLAAALEAASENLQLALLPSVATPEAVLRERVRDVLNTSSELCAASAWLLGDEAPR